MAPKHDRSISDQSSHQVARRREVTAQRVRRFRARQQALHNHSVQPPVERLQQGEQLIDLALTEDEIAAVTLTQLGVRVQGVTLGQGDTNRQEQARASATNEYEQLYQEDTRPLAPSNSGFFRRFTVQSSAEVESGRPAPRPLSQYFRTLPAQNRSAPHVPHEDTTHANVSTPLQALLRSTDDHFPEPTSIEHQNNTTIETGSAGGTSYEETAWQPLDEPASTEQEENIAPEPPEHSESSGEESAYPFASEHSVHDEEESDTDARVAAVVDMADRLYQQLIVQFHGCSPEEHDEEARKHLEAAGDNHHGLGQVFNDPDFPSVLGLKDMITPQRLVEQQTPSSRQWEAMFCGLDRRRRFPQNVCLHKEETRAIGAKVAFDVDSFLGFASSPAIAKKGIWCQFVPQMRQNIVSDVHINTQTYQTHDGAEQPQRASSVMVRDVPHFLFGRVHGAHDVMIHVLFPHLQTGPQKFVSLTKEELTRWLDRVFLPAIYRFYDADYTQHIPGNFKHAYANSKAHQVEGRQIETASYTAQQAVGYHLEPGTLEQIWTDILHTVNTTPGLADFRDAQLFFSAKGTKLEFKTYGSRRTLLDVLEFFQSTFENVIDTSFVELDRFYVDVGKEVCPRVHLLAHEVPHTDDEAQVYLRKRCCLEKYLQWMYDGQPPPPGRGQLYFTQNMLHQAASLTSVTPRRSKQRESGLVYSQLYSSVKEIVDATKRFLFSNDGMEEMTLDPEIRRGAYQAAGRNRSSTRIVENAYLASKRRTADALAASRQKSFGIREEHRISWELFLALRDRLLEEDYKELEIELSDCPSYAWPVKTSVYMDFLWRSADKFATGFEVVRAQCRKELVTWEQTKMMAMFLRCLRFVFGGHLLSRESAIWWSRREAHVGEPPRLRVWFGLGFTNTLPRHGYCWIEPRIDWERLQFHSHVTDNVLFGNRVLQGQYVRRGRQLQAFVDITRRLEVALEWLKAHRNIRVIRDRLIRWVVHICLQQFRIDVIQCVKAEILPQNREEAIQGKEPICREWLEQIIGGPIHYMSGNRCDFKLVPHLGHFLFDFGDGLKREHWEDRPFRTLYHRASISIALLGREPKQAFRQCFWKTFYRHHWVLPYPCANAFMQTTKQGQRMWYSIQVRDGVNVWEAEEKDWIWARKSWQPGRPRSLPEWTEWEKEQWEKWIEEHSS